MSAQKRPVIGISIGDLNGIGFELILNTFSDGRILEFCTPVVFGNKDLGDKLMEGDKRTPEGNFKIISKRPHEKWHRRRTL